MLTLFLSLVIITLDELLKSKNICPKIPQQLLFMLLSPADWTTATHFCTAFQNIWFSGYKQSKIVLPALFRASRGMHVLHQSSGQLHWLPVESRIIFKILLLVYKSLNNLAPAYINSPLKNYKPSRNLRSVDQGLLTVQRSNQRTYGNRAFSVAAPKLWNSLPLDIRNSGSITLLKTFLFKKYCL